MLRRLRPAHRPEPLTAATRHDAGKIIAVLRHRLGKKVNGLTFANLQPPTSNLQLTSKQQTSTRSICPHGDSIARPIGAWFLKFIWSLDLGAWSLTGGWGLDVGGSR